MVNFHFFTMKFVAQFWQSKSKNKFTPLLFCSALLGASAANAETQQPILELENAIAIAQLQDPWLEQNQYRESAIREQSIAAAALPDPVVSLSIANLPTNGWALNQEPMTQIKAGLSQRFRRGDSRAIQSKQQLQLAEQFPYLRQNRKAKVRVTVAELWLDAYRAQASIQLIEKDRALFEQLGDIVEANYASAIRQTRQQDIVRANLEISRITDRILSLQANQDEAFAKLQQWISSPIGITLKMYTLPKQLPEISLQKPNLEAMLSDTYLQNISQLLNQHPYILAIEQQIKASRSTIELAQQQYKPQWGVNASYAYRADDKLGQSRADFVSVGVSFDLPLFTENRQDKEVSAKIYEAEAIKTDKQLVMRSLLSGLQASYAKYKRLQDRKQLYETEILTQMTQLSEVSLSAYTNDDGSFTEVVQARIAELNTHLDMLNIEVDLYKSMIQLDYYFTQAKATPNNNLGTSNDK